MTDFRPQPTPEQAQALEVFRSHESFLLAAHVRPDGDCLGSQAAMARVLQAMGKKVVVLNPDPPDPEFLAMTACADFREYKGGPIPQHDVCVLLDINDLSRCGDLAEPLRAAPSTKVVVDHHPFEGTPWWDASFVDISASATGLLVHRIAAALGVEIDAQAALAIFVSLVTDTGWFRYSNTDAETMAVASELVDAGVRPAEVFSMLYQQNHSNEPQALGNVLQRVQYHADRRLAVLDLPLSNGGLRDSDTMLDIVRAVADVEVVLFVKELEPGLCKLSARSKSFYDVNALARKFGGGGHVRASGATIRGELEEVRGALVEKALEGFAELDRAEASVGGVR